MNNLILPPDKNQNPVPVLSIGISQYVTNLQTCSIADCEGLISETPNFETFVGELMSKGLSEIVIETIRENVQL